MTRFAKAVVCTDPVVPISRVCNSPTYSFQEYVTHPEYVSCLTYHFET